MLQSETRSDTGCSRNRGSKDSLISCVASQMVLTTACKQIDELGVEGGAYGMEGLVMLAQFFFVSVRDSLSLCDTSFKRHTGTHTICGFFL